MIAVAMAGETTVGEIVALGALGVIAVVLAAVGLYLAWGLFQARSLLRREFGAYFLSPIAYVVFVAFLLVTGHLFYLRLDDLTAKGPYGAEYPMREILGDERFWLVFLFIPPLLTMRLFAEERSTGTLEMLMTAPLRDWQVVLSKFLACFAFYLVLWMPTLLYVPVLVGARHWHYDANGWTLFSFVMVGGLAAALAGLLLLIPPLGTFGRILSLIMILGGVGFGGLAGWLHYTRDPARIFEIPVGLDPMPLASSYLGVALAGAMFLSIGLFISSLVRSQMVSALISLIISLVFVLAAFWQPNLDTGSGLYRILYYFSVPLHFRLDFSRGLIDTRPLILYASATVFCLFLTVRSLESRRWR